MNKKLQSSGRDQIILLFPPADDVRVTKTDQLNEFLGKQPAFREDKAQPRDTKEISQVHRINMPDSVLPKADLESFDLQPLHFVLHNSETLLLDSSSLLSRYPPNTGIEHASSENVGEEVGIREANKLATCEALTAQVPLFVKLDLLDQVLEKYQEVGTTLSQKDDRPATRNIKELDGVTHPDLDLSSDKIIPTSKIQPKEKSILCPYCPYQTNRQNHLNEHIRIIHLFMKTVCDLCGKEFVNINQHMRVVHKILRSGLLSKQKCQECGKEYFDLTKHMAKAHGLKYDHEFQCDKCDVRFKSKFIMQRHNQRKHGVKAECGECGKKVANLDIHIKTTHNKDEGLKVCSLCLRQFKRSSDAVRHSLSCGAAEGSTAAVARLYYTPEPSTSSGSAASSGTVVISTPTAMSRQGVGLEQPAVRPRLALGSSLADISEPTISLELGAGTSGPEVVNSRVLDARAQDLVPQIFPQSNDRHPLEGLDSDEDISKKSNMMDLKEELILPSISLVQTQQDGTLPGPQPSPSRSSLEQELPVAKLPDVQSVTVLSGSRLAQQLSGAVKPLPDQQLEDSESWEMVRVEIQVDNLNFVKINGSLTETTNQNFMECSGHEDDPLGDHQGEEERGRPNKPSNSSLVTCPACPDRPSVKDLSRHNARYHKEKKSRVRPRPVHQCELCGYSTNRITNFKLHVKQVHMRSRTVCHLCGKEYSNINQHMRVVHKTLKSGLTKQERCPYCHQEYYNLQQHMRRAHKLNIEPRDTTCKTCGEKFAKHANMLRHVLRVHEGVRTSCPICQKQVSNMAKHSAIHASQLMLLPVRQEDTTEIVKRAGSNGPLLLLPPYREQHRPPPHQEQRREQRLSPHSNADPIIDQIQSSVANMSPR